MKTDVRNLIASANPVSVDPRSAQSVRAVSALQRILAEEPTGPTSSRTAIRPRPILIIASAIAVVALALGVGVPFLGGTDAPAYAATPAVLTIQHAPQEGAEAALLSIAKNAASVPDDVGRGSVAQVSTQSWSLFTRVDGEQVTSEVVPESTVSRTSADGTAVIETRYTYDGESHKEAFTTNGGLNYGPRSLSSKDAELRRQLSIGQPASNGTAGKFDSVVVAYRQMPIEPRVRAAVLRYVAAAEGVKTVGTVSDRFGRQGVGFIVDSDYSGLPTRYMLIFDPLDGRLLGYEETLTSDPGKLNVRIPSVIQYIAFESAKYVD